MFTFECLNLNNYGIFLWMEGVLLLFFSDVFSKIRNKAFRSKLDHVTQRWCCRNPFQPLDGPLYIPIKVCGAPALPLLQLQSMLPFPLIAHFWYGFIFMISEQWAPRVLLCHVWVPLRLLPLYLFSTLASEEIHQEQWWGVQETISFDENKVNKGKTRMCKIIKKKSSSSSSCTL